ncbi:TPA: hypothetical protein DDW35_05325 [Candidatus Sumerlaeota bacterium]|nr:hypothetical protein [Candidatus Sumerlaeota bacterium]
MLYLRHLIAFCTLVLCLISGAASFADTVELVDGRKLPCVVKDKTTNPVEIFTATGALQIPQARIKQITLDSAAGNLLVRAEFKLTAGVLPEAEKFLRDAQASGVAKPALRDWLMRQRSTFPKHLKDRPAKEREFWIALTRKAAEPDPPPSVEFLAGMSGSFASAGDSKFALELFGRIPEAQWKNFAQDESTIRMVLVDQLKAMLNAKDFDHATNLVQRIKTAGLPCAKSAQLYVAIRQAATMRSAGRYTETLTYLEQFVKPTSPALARERMSAVLTVARVELVKMEDYERALKLYEEWGKRVLDDKARDCQADLLKLWGESLVKRERYAEARAKLESHYKMLPASKDEVTSADLKTSGTLLDVCEFHARFDALKPGEFAAAFELGEWAGGRGMLRESIQAFQRAAQHESLQKTAAEQIALARKQIALQHFQKCVEQVDKNHPREAMKLLEEFPKEGTQNDPEIEARRIKLRKVCLSELKRQEDLRDFQAQALLSGARDRILKGERNGIEKALAVIEDQFPNSPHAIEAENLSNAFHRRIAIEDVENMKEPYPELLVPNPVACREAESILEGLGEKK